MIRVLCVLGVFTMAYAAVTFQNVCSGDALPPSAIPFGNAQSMWSPSSSVQYLCIPQGTNLFGHMTDPSDGSVSFPGYCFYYNTTSNPSQLAASTKCSQIAVSSTPITWVTVSSGFPIQPNMVTIGSLVAARTAIPSTNFGNLVPGFVSTYNGTLGSLICDDFGYTNVDSYQVGLTSAPSNGPLPASQTPGSGLRVVLGVVTQEAVDIVIQPFGTNIIYNLTAFQFGHVSQWLYVTTPQYTMSVYHNVNGNRAELLYKTVGLFYGPASTSVLAGTWPPTMVYAVGGYVKQPGNATGYVRLVNMAINSNPLGLKCNGITIIAEQTNYTMTSDYSVVCGIAPVLSVTTNGGVIVANLSTAPATYSYSTIYVLGDMSQAFPPVEAFLLLDRPLI